jgi:hypothetical protein
MDLSGRKEEMSERKKSMNLKDIRDFYMNLRRFTNLLLW